MSIFNILLCRKHDAESIFIGTRAGLTRVLSLTDVKAERFVVIEPL